MITYGDVRQLAGLLEGEATFGFYKGAIRVSLAMTDADVVQWAQKVVGHTKPLRTQTPKRGRPLLVLGLYGEDAAGWMMMIYPFMGLRRKERIRRCLAQWRITALSASKRTHCPQGHPYDRTYTLAVDGRNQRTCSICNRNWRVMHRNKTSVGERQLRVV